MGESLRPQPVRSHLWPAAFTTALLTAVISISADAQIDNGATVRFAGVPERGAELASRWCSSCHDMAKREAEPGPPPFSVLARRLPRDADILAGLIADPHPPMPNLSLSRQDIQDVLAFIGTLR
ncbi:MAG: cytochrome c [Bauldia sp.]